MLRVLAFLLALCVSAHSEESSPRKSESKAKAPQTDNQQGTAPQQATAPSPAAAPIINIYTVHPTQRLEGMGRVFLVP
jgi:hypothetical protein